MRIELFLNPRKLIERLATESLRKRRFAKLKNTCAKPLSLGHIDSLELLELIKAEFEIKIIYDIGANVGTWSVLAKAIFPHSKIIAFEPLPVHIQIFKKETEKLKNLILLPFALGQKNEKAFINVSSFSDASSLLPSTDALKSEYNITELETVEIEVLRLDEVQIDGKKIPQSDLIKLDIQGYELEALKGGEKLIRKTKYIIMEVSFVEYYKGQPLFEEVILYLHSINFKLKALGYNTPIGADLKQMDVLFINTNL